MTSPFLLDPAALARSLRISPAALRIVDLSALAQDAREAEVRRLGGADLPPRLRVRVGALAGEPGETDWLVFQRDAERGYASPGEYWNARLSALPPGPALVTIPSSGAPARRRVAELDAETWGTLRSRAARAGFSPAALLLAMLADVLAAWCAEPRFTVDLGVAGTPAWVPLALDGGAPGTFEERAGALHTRLRRDLAYALSRSERAGHPPSAVAVELPARLFGEDGEKTGKTAPAAALLRLQAAEREGALLLFWDVAEPAFPPGMADALTGAARGLLRRLAAGPVWREARRRLIPPQQLARMVAFNTTGSPLPKPYPRELFAEQARRQPDHTAVTGPRGSATYGELLRAADVLGHLLQKEGARRNTPVAVVLEPRWEAVAALLGVLAAGAAYLPVDPGLPRRRFRALLEQGRIELAVTREGLADSLDWPEDLVGVMIEDAWKAAPSLPQGPPAVPSASPKDLACILAGPDGPVMIESRGVANLVADLGDRFALGPGDRTLALAPLSAGLSLPEIFGTLAAGGTVVLSGRTGPDRLAARIGRAGITVLAATPALVESLLDAGCSFSPLRVLLLSGGTMPPDLPADLPGRLRRLRPGLRIAWLDGSLETSVWASVLEIGEETPARRLGRPLSNQTFHVLDGRMELRPFWVPGDLYAGGTGLARGYWRNPARSAERFAIHPDTGERLFRTGRRAHWLPGGEMELDD